MLTCDTCGIEIKRPITHMKTNDKLCLKCVTESACFTLPEHELISPDERRTNIRIPLKLKNIHTDIVTMMAMMAMATALLIAGIILGRISSEGMPARRGMAEA